ncbi:MAG: hypothetical protein JXA69_11905 [Phycisphaerae bacterium]|nr:hypothetical protein [Phycisphaerae bacterium]
MHTHQIKWLWLSILAGAAVAGCEGLAVTLPDGLTLGYHIVSITVTNTTDYYVDPRIYADDDDNTFFDSNIVTNENYVDTGVIPPYTSVTVTLNCDQAGTIKSDYAILELPGADWVESDNAPKVTDDNDFDCGDSIEFIFIDTGVEFFTRVEINGRFIED